MPEKALIIVDVEAPWASKNPQKTRDIADFITTLRGMDAAQSALLLVWVYTRPQVALPAFWRDAPENIVRTTPQIARPAGQDLFIVKNREDAFSNPELSRLLRTKGVKDAYFAGFATRQCVLESAKGALRTCFNAYLLQDHTADYNDAPCNPEFERYREARIGLCTGNDLIQRLSPA